MPLIAQWIWDAGDPAPRNRHQQFRRSFQLPLAAADAHLHLSADSRYLLYVNGARIGYGPARNYQFHYEYDTYDLAPHLRPGANVIAIDVSHWGEATFHHRVGRGGLIAQLDLNGQPHLWTGADWLTKPSAAFIQNTPRIACQMAWEEQVDARLEDVGWTDTAFDDAAWEPATVIGPDGTAPWSVLSPRTIPFLTDEPVNPVRAHAAGRFRRPEVVAALHAGPYLAPGDMSANKQQADALFATVLHMPQAGAVRLKHPTIAGGDMPTTYIDGVRVNWLDADCDEAAELTLVAGDHALLLDWHGYTHDMDLSVTASGMAGLAVTSLLPGEGDTWAVATLPGPARAAALAATSVAALRDCGAAWQAVAVENTPPADIYMDLTASVVACHRPTSLPVGSTVGVQPEHRAVRLPLRVPPVPDGEAQRYLIDFGRLLMGWLEIEVEAPAGTTFDLLAYEAVQEGRPQITTFINNTLRYVCRAGRQTFTSTLRRGCRYLIVAVHGNAGEALLHRATVRLSTYPWDIQGAFRSSDARLNQVWEMCAYTMRLCSEDTFTDNPTYEQTFWIGDACYTDVITHQVVHGDPRLTRRCLLLVADSLQRVPIGNKIVPGDWENERLPNWAWLWAMGCGAFYQLTGDTAFAAAVYPALAQQAQMIATHRNAAGMLDLQGYWHLMDWARIPDSPELVLTHESCLAVAALRATAALGRVAGQMAGADHWTQIADELAAAINAACWREDRQAYADLWDNGPSGNTSQPTNIAAVLSGVATPERAAAVLPHLLYAPDDWIPNGSPWSVSLGGMLLAERGQVTPMLDAFRDRWGDMLDKGATAAWEIFSGFEPMKDWWTRSWAQGWSAFPSYLLAAYVLGVRPLEPGYARALIAPQLGDLQWAEGRVPTPHGVITVRAERAGAGLRVVLTLPAGVVGDVRLPMHRTAPVITGSPAEVQSVGAEFSITLPAGAHATISA